MNENPCSQQEIHMLFEHGFKLENASNEPSYIHTRSIADQIDHFAMLLFAKTLRTAMT